MKKIFLLLAFSMVAGRMIFAQVAVNTDGSLPATSAILDAKSTTSGFLPPRMTLQQRNAIPAPAEGLLVVCTDCGANQEAGLSIFLNNEWKLIECLCSPPGSPLQDSLVSSRSAILWKWKPTAAIGYKFNTVNNYNTSTNLGSSTSMAENGLTPNTAYTRYIWAYNACGVSTRGKLTYSTSLNSLPAPTAGSHISSLNKIIWNWGPVLGATGYKWNTENNSGSAIDLGGLTTKTDTGLLCETSYIRYVWAYDPYGISQPATLIQATSSDPVAAPTMGVHSSTQDQVIWRWYPVAGAAGYRWSAVNNYASATNLGTDTIKIETGLNCNTMYTRYVWAYKTCGHSESVSTIFGTNACSSPFVCGQDIVVNHLAGAVAPVNKTLAYGTINNIPGDSSKCWITRNLGASQQATTVNDNTEPPAGWYWQFNCQQGYQCIGGSNVIPGWATCSTIGNTDWIASNDPCSLELGSAWHIPTASEWMHVSQYWADWNDPWYSALKLHAAGYLSGSVYFRGVSGNYWSSSQSDDFWGYQLRFESSSCGVSGDWKYRGRSLRCLRNP